MELKKLIVVNLAAFIGPFGGNAIIPLFEPLATAFGTTYELTALSITFLMIPFAIIQFFSGTISDLFNRQKVCVIGLITYGLGAILVGVSQTLEFLLFARVIQGIGYGFIFPVLVALIGDLSSSEQRGKVMGYLGISTMAGVAFGPLSAGFLGNYGWQVIFFITASMTLLIGILFWLIFRNFPPPLGEKHSFKDFFSQMKKTLTKNVFLFSMLGFVLFLSYITINVSIGQRYKDLFETFLTESERMNDLGIFLFFSGLSGMIASPFAGRAIDKFGRKKTAYIGGLIVVITVSMFILGNSFISFVALFFCLGTGTATIWTAYNTITVELDPMAKGTVSSISSGIRFFGYSLAAPLSIFLGLPLLYLVCAFLALMVLGLLYLLRVSPTENSTQ